MRWRLRRRRDPGDGGSAELDARLSETWEAAATATGKMLDLREGKESLLASSGLLPEGTADLPASAGTTRRVTRRRRRLALLSAAAATLAAGAVALVVIGVPEAGHNRTDLTADVVKRVDSALSAAEPGEIAQVTGTTTRNAAMTTAEEWFFGGQWRLVTNSSAGHPVYDEGLSAASVYTVVSYQRRIWARHHGPGAPVAPSLAPVSGPRGCDTVVAALPSLFVPGLPGTGFSGATLTSALRAAISCGTLAVAGRQRVYGIEAMKLTSSLGSLVSETIWVSPGTYLPVRVVVRSVPVALTADFTWLPRTAQNLARLTVPIPAGFRRVPFVTAVAPATHERASNLK